ncbi:MAG: hypothetical protein UV34_C0037G0001 [Parcubacteria group bacterium GW2011_GWB1_42_6]|nr:MAG: hypothetical protein UV34_C0037G0001 [Parcubacteria group bacterium GW2011_GWB1_42_6]
MQSFLKKFWPFLLLAVLSFAIHFAGLSHPSQVVFDEVHFGKFVTAYFTGEYYFDIHPPLGKLLIAGFAKLNGFNSVFDFEHIGKEASDNLFFTLRFLPAFFGSLFVLIFSWFAWLLVKSKKAALVAGLLILLDNAFLVQSKFILVDIFLVFFEILTLCFFLLSQRQKRFDLKWWIFGILTGISFGLTASIKWTGLAVIGIIGAVLIAKIFSQKFNRAIIQKEQSFSVLSRLKESAAAFAIISISGFLIYLIPFAIHFNLLNKSGPGDAFMSKPFQEELQFGMASGGKNLSFFEKFKELNKIMYTANAGITGEHPYGSKWFQWPFNQKPIYYWNLENPTISGQIGKIYFSGNPILWWLAGLSVLAIIVLSFFKKYRRNLEPIFFILIVGYFANLLPFILVDRVAFMYHYLPAVCFAIMILSILLAKFWPEKKAILLAILFLVLVGFISLMPFSYGIPISQEAAKIQESIVQ